MTVLALHKPKPCDDVVTGLRGLADRIEAGEVTTSPTTGAFRVSEGENDET